MWRGIKAKRELTEKETPTPQIVWGDLFLLLLTRYFLWHQCDISVTYFVTFVTFVWRLCDAEFFSGVKTVWHLCDIWACNLYFFGYKKGVTHVTFLEFNSIKMEMEFRTQGELLEYLGKYNDRNLIKRMEKRGEVRRWEWVYYLIVKDGDEEEKPDLKFISRVMWEKVLDHGEINRLNEEIEWLKSDLDFQISENGKLEAKVKRYQDAIRNSFYYINDTLHKKIDWPTYKATIKLEWDLPWEDNQ